MAAYGFGRCEHDSARFREWECEKRSRDHRDGIGVVWIRVADCGDDWVVDHDIEYQSVGPVDG